MTDNNGNDQLAEIHCETRTRPHGYFMLAADLAFARSKAEIEVEASIDRLTAATFCAFTLEGYLNWLGSEKVEHWKELERISPIQKLLVITSFLGIEIDRSHRPFSSFKGVFSFRNNFIAHGKADSVATTFLQGSEPIIPVPRIESDCSIENIERWMCDTKLIVETIHKSAGYVESPFGRLTNAYTVKASLL
jgi:hypothetical protein